MQRPLIPATLSFITGLLFGHGFLYFPYSIMALAVLGIIVLAVLIRFDRLAYLRTILLVLPCIGAGRVLEARQ